MEKVRTRKYRVAQVVKEKFLLTSKLPFCFSVGQNATSKGQLTKTLPQRLWPPPCMLQAGKDKLIMYLCKRLYGRLAPAQIGISKLFPENPLMLSLTLSFGSASARRLFFNALPPVIARCASCQLHITNAGILSQIRTKLRDWAAWQARAGCYSQAALFSNDSKTL